jgi:hypothetical protein
MNVEKIKYMYSKYITKKLGKIKILYIVISNVTKNVAKLKYVQYQS